MSQCWPHPLSCVFAVRLTVGEGALRPEWFGLAAGDDAAISGVARARWESIRRRGESSLWACAGRITTAWWRSGLACCTCARTKTALPALLSAVRRPYQPLSPASPLPSQDGCMDGSERGTPGSLQGQYRAGGRVHTPAVGRHQLHPQGSSTAERVGRRSGKRAQFTSARRASTRVRRYRMRTRRSTGCRLDRTTSSTGAATWLW